jgi:hypothetical protein
MRRQFPRKFTLVDLFQARHNDAATEMPDPSFAITGDQSDRTSHGDEGERAPASIVFSRSRVWRDPIATTFSHSRYVRFHVALGT